TLAQTPAAHELESRPVVVQVLEHRAGAHDDRLEWPFGQVHRNLALLGQEHVQAAEQPAAPGQEHPRLEHVVGELRRCLSERAPRPLDDPRHRLGHGRPKPAAFSPMATPKRARMSSWIAASKSTPPTLIDPPETTPPMETTAISVVPPPTSMIRLPTGSWIGSPAPIAAARGSSTSTTLRPPANRTASSTARRSTSELSDGMHTRTRGLGIREAPTRRRTTAIMRSVISNSVITPWRSGRIATTLPDRPPIICQASSPIASTSPVDAFMATTVGSLNTMPSPWR